MNMTEVNTQELSGDALDWAVSQAIGAYRGQYRFSENGPLDQAWIFPEGIPCKATTGKFCPSTDWSQCGPLISKIKIGFGPALGGWVAHPHRPNAPTDWLTADEPLVAICRAIVADKLGMAVNVPAELIQL
ncbi:hypothetical protein C1893_01970 [Pseudomonas sp. MPR-ANC1]|uniref:phage protein NinX family protein n=1 Tax=Pseudomonas sp. MPR-ANC1 TaxID=2075548 RepID=UPI000CD2A1F6|nr:phage protein NinX family protein [Pseudomonas sp. MPR-ANC1]POA50343.1 hypothetical protein C1893_01970 [Pseudomonas sp. MPR-ANC1]